MPKTLEPTWRGVAPLIFHAIKNGNEAAEVAAAAELVTMAEAADLYNASIHDEPPAARAQAPAEPDYETLAREAGYEIDKDSSGEQHWMLGPYDPNATSTFYETAKEVCEAEGLGAITPPTTDEVGIYIRDMLGEGYIDAAEVTGGCRDSIDHTDDSDASNLRLVMASGAVFVVRIVREG